MVAPASRVVVDIVSDTVCPWCYIGKRRLEAAMRKFEGQKQFEVRWHPFQLNPQADPKKGVNKMEMYKQKFGEERVEQMVPAMTETFAKEGMEYSMEGMTGNTFDSHRLIWLAGEQGADKQDAVVEELFKNYFTQGKYINDKEVLLAAAEKAGVQGAEKLFTDEDLGKEEVMQELNTYAKGISGVPHFMINRKYALSGAQDAGTFAKVFEQLC
jgi:predicted DsbA family dithiol-disulfide isomerase